MQMLVQFSYQDLPSFKQIGRHKRGMLHLFKGRGGIHADPLMDPFGPQTSDILPEAYSIINSKLGGKFSHGRKKYSGVNEGKLKGRVASCLGVSTNFPLERSIKVHIPNSNDSKKSPYLK